MSCRRWSAGVGVDRRHQAVLDADRVVEHLRDRRQAVGRAGGVGDDVVLVRVVGSSKLTPSTTVTSGSLAGRGDDRPSWRRPSRCLAASSRVGEEAGRLDHDVDAEVAPRQRRRVALGEDLDLVAVDDDARRSVASTSPGKRPEDRVVLEQVGERLGVGEVVDRDELDVGARGSCAARKTLRPMRPKPLMPTRTDMEVRSFLRLAEAAGRAMRRRRRQGYPSAAPRRRTTRAPIRGRRPSGRRASTSRCTTSTTMSSRSPKRRARCSAIATERWRPPVQPIAIVRCALPSATYCGSRKSSSGSRRS